MINTNRQKFVKHYKTKGFLYAVYRGIKYIRWRSICREKGIDWKRFSQTNID